MSVKPRQSRYSFRAFYLTVLCIAILTVISLFADQLAKYRHGVQPGFTRRNVFMADDQRMAETAVEVRTI